jgi:hypothetical protein
VAHGGKAVEKGVAVLTQSGNFAYNLSMSDRSLPVAYMASVGNQAQLGVAELMDVLLDEPRVTAIGLHLEGLKNVPGFARAAHKALEKGVPIIALKTGVSQIGAELALSHTSSLSGSDALYDALFARLGVIRVSGPVSFVETLKAAACGNLPGGQQPDRPGLFRGRRRADRRLRRTQRTGAAQARRGSNRRAGASAAQLRQPGQPAGFHHGDLGRWRGTEPHARQRPAHRSRCRDAGARLPVRVHRRTQGMRPAAGPVLQGAGAPRQNRFRHLGLPELLPAHARERLHEQGVAALQGVEDGLAAWGRIANYQRNRQALLALGESALVPLCPQALQGEGRLLNEWDSKQALREFGLPTPNGVLSSPAGHCRTPTPWVIRWCSRRSAPSCRTKPKPAPWR